MFSKMQEVMGQFGVMQKLMKDENFRSFIAHPRVQELFRDPEFKEVAKTRDLARILSHPKCAEIMRDPDLASLLSKLNAQALLGKGPFPV